MLCGDATNAADLARLLNGDEPTVLATDPPYGVSLDPSWRDGVYNELGPAEAPYMRTKGHRNTTVSGDTRIDWSEAFALVPSLQVGYVWHAGVHAAEVAAGLARIGFEIASQVIWDKGLFAMGRSWYHWGHEPCWVIRKPGIPNLFHGSRDQSTIWRAPSPKMIMAGSLEEKQDHPAQKPVLLFETPIRNHLEAGEAVYDPFLGSGASSRPRRSVGAATRWGSTRSTSRSRSSAGRLSPAGRRSGPMARATGLPEMLAPVALELAGRDDVGLADQARPQPSGLHLMTKRRSRQPELGGGLAEGQHPLLLGGRKVLRRVVGDSSRLEFGLRSPQPAGVLDLVAERDAQDPTLNAQLGDAHGSLGRFESLGRLVQRDEVRHLGGHIALRRDAVHPGLSFLPVHPCVAVPAGCAASVRDRGADRQASLRLRHQAIESFLAGLGSGAGVHAHNMAAIGHVVKASYPHSMATFDGCARPDPDSAGAASRWQIDPLYVQLAIERWQAVTGRTAERSMVDRVAALRHQR